MGIVAISGCTNQTGNNTSSQTGNTSGAYTVNIQNFAFNPATLNVPVGTTVKWVNMDSTTHHIVSDTGAFQSPNLSSGQSYTYTFTQAGSYPYHCSIHTSMTGTIVVGTPSTSTPSTTTPSTSSGQSSSSGGYSY